MEEIEQYVAEKNLNVEPKSFYDYFEATDWIDSRGNKVKSWKGKLQTWNGFHKQDNKISKDKEQDEKDKLIEKYRKEWGL